jgi:hypothetical protein
MDERRQGSGGGGEGATAVDRGEVVGQTVVEERSGAISGPTTMEERRQGSKGGGERDDDNGGEVAGPTVVERRGARLAGREGKKKATWCGGHRHMCLTRGI